MPEQAETDRVAAPPVMLLLHDPRGRDEAEAAQRNERGGQQQPEAAHTAEHGAGATRGFFPVPVKQYMHLECARYTWKRTYYVLGKQYYIQVTCVLEYIKLLIPVTDQGAWHEV